MAIYGIPFVKKGLSYFFGMQSLVAKDLQKRSFGKSGELKKMRDFICNVKFFPTCLIILNLLAAGRYGLDGDVRKVVYWLSAAALTTAVTY